MLQFDPIDEADGDIQEHLNAILITVVGHWFIIIITTAQCINIWVVLWLWPPTA